MTQVACNNSCCYENCYNKTVGRIPKTQTSKKRKVLKVTHIKVNVGNVCILRHICVDFFGIDMQDK